jgi:signal transduction histidine kinase
MVGASRGLCRFGPARALLKGTGVDYAVVTFKAQQRLWRRTLLVGVALLAVYFPLDMRLPAGMRAAAWRLGWIAVLLGAAALQRPARQRLSAGAIRVAIVSSGVAGIAVVAYGGGTESARFGFLLAFPLVGLVLFPEFPVSVALLGLTCLLGGAGLLLNEGRDVWFAFEWTVLSLALTVLAVLGAVAFRRLWLSEVLAQRSRAEALEQLGESERRRAESERLALVGRLAAGVAHEINTPLSYVKANVGFLRDEPLADEARVALADALAGIERIAQIVTDMRGMARAGPDAKEVFAVEDALDEAWRLASVRLATVRASWSAEPGLPRLVGSRRLLVQALVNLAVNAADAASTATDPARRWVKASALGCATGVAIHVDDGGPGLPPPVSDRLFEMFVSTKGAAGMGLGLALVREQVTLLGGTVEGGNRRDGGARFTIRLPAAPCGAKLRA